MRKSILGALISSAFALSGTAHAGLVLDLNGSLAGGVIEADALDWSPTSFLAKGGNTAINNFVGTGGACGGGACEFDVLTHARLTGYSPTGGGGSIGIPGGFGEITMVARYTERVSGVSGAGFSASFRSTGAGWLEFYWSPAVDGSDLTGSGFNNGTLIGRLSGVQTNVLGTFTVDDQVGPLALDGSADGNDYAGQLTVTGNGSQGALAAGTTGIDLDGTFFQTLLSSFSIKYENISIGLPYAVANPSHCFNPNQSASAVGSTGQVSTCDTDAVNGLFSAQGAETGYTPLIGVVNGDGRSSPDFIAQTDFNSAVSGAVPEPGSLALVGLALGAMGFAASRRRRS